MTYSRPPVQAGRALRRKPVLPDETTAGVLDYSLDADISTTTTLGVVQVGSGLSITLGGILSATNTGFLNVFLTSTDYTATLDDYYIGALEKDIIITLPLGIVGKVFIVKNQLKNSKTGGNIKVQGSAGQKLDEMSFKTLGTNASLIVVFDEFRWNLV